MSKFAIPALAALGLIAASAQSQAESRQPVGLGWHLSREGEMAKLAYGLANSDQLALMIMCRPGQAHAVVYGDMAPASRRLTPVSANNAIDPLSGGLVQESRIRLDDPALRRLAREGKMPVVSDAGRSELRAVGQDRRAVAGFMSYCSGGRA